MQKDQIQVILLAAGNSKRFGSPKLEYRFEQGKTILEKTLSVYLEVFPAKQISVVLQPGSRLVDIISKLNVNIIENAKPELGMSYSIVLGINNHANCLAYLIGLADMPYLKVTTLKKLSSQAEIDQIVIPKHKKNQGNPVIFGKKFVQDLLVLTGDVGAKSVIRNNQNSIINVEVEDIGVLQDIDRLEDVLNS